MELLFIKDRVAVRLLQVLSLLHSVLMEDVQWPLMLLTT